MSTHNQVTGEAATPRTRRAILMAAAGSVGALVASAMGGRVPQVKAAAGAPFVIGDTNDAGSSQSVILSSAGGAAFTLKDSAANGTGVFGWASATTGIGRGLYGRTDAANGIGVQAKHNGAAGFGAALDAIAGPNVAIRASSTSVGIQVATTGSGTGVEIDTQNGPGLWVTAPANYAVAGVSGSGIGVFGNSNTNWSGLFQVDARVNNDFQVGGNQSVDGYLDVVGTLSKGGGSFKIDHPLDPAGKFLQHSFVESPDMKNIYDGVARLDAKGEATIEMPDWFHALNRDFRYQLTPHGSFGELYVRSTLREGRFSIAGGKPGQDVSWQVTGIRLDAWANANRIQVEVDKTGPDSGTYRHPELHGQPGSKRRAPKHPIGDPTDQRPR